MGDDIVDLAVLARVGLSTAPADAVRRGPRARALGQPRRAADGARPANWSRLILRAQNHWDGVVASYLQTEGRRA